MRRFLKTKLFILGVVVVAASLAVGVALAATQGGADSTSSVSPQFGRANPEIVLEKQTVLKGTPAITVLGAGWTPLTTALVKIQVGGAAPDIIVGSARVEMSGAFKLEASELGKSIDPGVYTVTASVATSGDNAAAPLVVVEELK